MSSNPVSGMSDVAIEKALDNLDKEVKTLKEILSHRQRNSMPKFKGFKQLEGKGNLVKEDDGLKEEEEDAKEEEEEEEEETITSKDAFRVVTTWRKAFFSFLIMALTQLGRIHPTLYGGKVITSTIVNATTFSLFTSQFVLYGNIFWMLWIFLTKQKSAVVSPKDGKAYRAPIWLKGFEEEPDAYKVLIAETQDCSDLPDRMERFLTKIYHKNEEGSHDIETPKQNAKQQDCSDILERTENETEGSKQRTFEKIHRFWFYYWEYILPPTTIITLQFLTLFFTGLHFWNNYEPKYVAENFGKLSYNNMQVMVVRYFALGLFIKISNTESKRNQDLFKIILLRPQSTAHRAFSTLIPILGEAICYLVLVTTCLLIVHSDNVQDIIMNCLAVAFVTDLDNVLLKDKDIANVKQKGDRWFSMETDGKYNRKVLMCFGCYDMVQAFTQLIITFLVLPCASFREPDEALRKLWFGTALKFKGGDDQHFYFNITNHTENMCMVKCYNEY